MFSLRMMFRFIVCKVTKKDWLDQANKSNIVDMVKSVVKSNVLIVTIIPFNASTTS